MPLRIRHPATIISSLFLFCLLLGIYALSYSGLPISDDEQLFASVAQNYALSGEFSAGQVYGNTRLVGQYHGAGPLHILFASLAYRLIAPTGFGGMQGMFFLPPLYTAVTAIFIYLLSRRRGYSSQVALLAGLLFGLGTIAWPYAKTFFREPLATLLLTGAWLAIEIALDIQVNPRTRAFAWLLFCIAMVGALLTKIMMAVAIPAFGILVWDRLDRGNLPVWIKDRSWTTKTAISTGICVLALSSLAIADVDIFYRFSSSFVRFSFNRLMTLPHAGFGQAIVGSLASPGKGLFIYSPVLILALLVVKPRWHLHKKDYYLGWSVLVGLVIAQALAYDDKWWNVTWGTRFTLPAIPFLIIAALPALEAMLASQSRRVRLVYACLIGLSLFIQIGGVLVDSSSYNAWLYHRFDRAYPWPAIWDPLYAALVGHWRLILAGETWDVAWARSFLFDLRPIYFVIFLIASLIVLSSWGLWRTLARPGTDKRLLGVIGTAILVLTLMPSAMLSAYRADPKYSADRMDLRAVEAWIRQKAGPGDVVIVRSYLYPVWYYLMNFGRFEIPWYSASMTWDDELKPVSLFDESTDQLLDILSTNYRRIWVISEKLSPVAQPISIGQEGYSTPGYWLVGSWSFPGPGRLQVVLFESRFCCRSKELIPQVGGLGD